MCPSSILVHSGRSLLERIFLNFRNAKQSCSFFICLHNHNDRTVRSLHSHGYCYRSAFFARFFFASPAQAVSYARTAYSILDRMYITLWILSLLSQMNSWITDFLVIALCCSPIITRSHTPHFFCIHSNRLLPFFPVFFSAVLIREQARESAANVLADDISDNKSINGENSNDWITVRLWCIFMLLLLLLLLKWHWTRNWTRWIDKNLCAFLFVSPLIAFDLSTFCRISRVRCYQTGSGYVR